MNDVNDFPYAPILAESKMGMQGTVENRYATAGWMARDEFAAHAPPVPDWFRTDLAGSYEEQRFFEWRWYYANSMLITRG
ncbi:hypothetical protein BLA39750_02207 [Burkholderia lata]|uniref:Uncharacterized protein n=1 Tax=Burkholderia lata (strain ATCC 17760 / DSM 23089 / LMG 22485 / NCIMB 9086 / R18194 / 383) TaxID=482957 RepID=A0A6P2W7X8_BURL3|nr:hypothetical protein [Burkholderia lata]VWC95708.1 hypothetical protein BLA39750_02207 [Burkholderia lata]